VNSSFSPDKVFVKYSGFLGLLPQNMEYSIRHREASIKCRVCSCNQKEAEHIQFNHLSHGPDIVPRGSAAEF
jgi:hypothetical protein